MKILAGLTALGLITLGGTAWAGAPGVTKVGELEPISLGSPHPYGIGSGANARTWTVRYPGATYIRVHFERFDLAPGDLLQVASPDGAESFAYAGRGPSDSGEFWANLIQGDTAILRLQSSSGNAFGFEVDSFGRGVVDIGAPIGEEPAQPDSVCGTQDWRDVKCYDPSAEYDQSKAAVIEYIGCCSACTAVKVSDSGQFLTNNHCASTASGVSSIELRFYYQTPGCGTGTASYTGSVRGNALNKTDAVLDYTLFTTTGDSSSVPCAALENRLPAVGERIYIPGHPNAGPKVLSIDSDQDPGGKCTVRAAPCAGNSATSDVCYYCDTIGGSSGSPVFSGNSNKVVALHHFGGCYNSGGRMDLIYPQISGLLGTCSGGGGGGAVCGNGVREGGEQCDGADLGGQTCQSQGFSGGTLSCTGSCTFNTSACTAACGARGTSCTSDAQCCSNNCSGPKNRKTCR